jgi:hypothetical protein
MVKMRIRQENHRRSISRWDKGIHRFLEQPPQPHLPSCKLAANQPADQTKHQMRYTSEVVMNQRFLLTTTCPLVLWFAFAVPAKSDTILVGTSLTDTVPVAVLGNTRFSQFSSPVNFNIDDIKVVIGGPATFNSTDGSFDVRMLTQVTGPLIPSTGVFVGSGNLPITLMDSIGSDVGVFDFSGLSISITAGTENYLGVAAGANLTWNSSTPLLGTLGTIGLQLSCPTGPPASIRCNNDPAIGLPFPGTYSMQISGDPVGVTPEPSSLLLLGTGLLSIVGAGSRRMAHA